jgi:TRAP-type C4-dicarboxylate transport system permease small subunit
MSGNTTSGRGVDWSSAPLPLRLVRGLSFVSGWIAATMIAVAIFITCQMIFIRYVLRESTIWQTECVVYLVVAATLIGLPFVQQRRGHVNVDLLPLMLPKTGRFVLALIVKGLSILVIGYIAWLSYEFWHEAWAWGERSDTLWGPPLWIPYLAMPVGFGLFLLQLVADYLMLIFGYEQPFGFSSDERFTTAKAKSGEEAT